MIVLGWILFVLGAIVGLVSLVFWAILASLVIKIVRGNGIADNIGEGLVALFGIGSVTLILALALLVPGYFLVWGTR